MRLLLSFVWGNVSKGVVQAEVVEVDVPRGRAAHVVVQEEMDRVSKQQLFTMYKCSFFSISHSVLPEEY
ncbi:MAG: hypothetical protein V4690_04080 [Patescibacteria group bacterium]